MMHYPVHPARIPPDLRGDWDGPAWRQAAVAGISHFRPESADYRPVAEARLLHGPAGLHGIFRVADRYVHCVQTAYQAPVCTDSCVEFFVQPRPDRGYFNFEFNCGGALLCSYITQPRVQSATVMLPPDEGRRVSIYHSLPAVVDPEIETGVTWFVEFHIPFDVLAGYVGPLGALAGQQWRANFYTCADHSSHPRWAAWSPVDALDFHMPQCFGAVLFDEL